MAYRLTYSAAAKRALTTELPESVAAACYEFIRRPLAENPHRVGARLRAPLEPYYRARRGEYRILYEIRETSVHVVAIAHRRATYR